MRIHVLVLVVALAAMASLAAAHEPHSHRGATYGVTAPVEFEVQQEFYRNEGRFELAEHRARFLEQFAAAIRELDTGRQITSARSLDLEVYHFFNQLQTPKS